MQSVERNLKFRDTYNKISEGTQTEIRKAAREQMKPYGLNEDSLVQHNTNLTGLALTAGLRGHSATNMSGKSSTLLAGIRPPRA
jgi:hypothetical protein